MKNIRKVIYALIVLNLVVDAAFLVLAPDQVAVHFGASGEADRIGSKYEHLWLSLIHIFLELCALASSKRAEKHHVPDLCAPLRAPKRKKYDLVNF